MCRLALRIFKLKTIWCALSSDLFSLAEIEPEVAASEDRHVRYAFMMMSADDCPHSFVAVHLECASKVVLDTRAAKSGCIHVQLPPF